MVGGRFHKRKESEGAGVSMWTKKVQEIVMPFLSIAQQQRIAHWIYKEERLRYGLW